MAKGPAPGALLRLGQSCIEQFARSESSALDRRQYRPGGSDASPIEQTVPAKKGQAGVLRYDIRLRRAGGRIHPASPREAIILLHTI